MNAAAQPLVANPVAWDLALSRGRAALETGRLEASPAVFAIVAVAVRTGAPGANDLLARARRLYVRAGPLSETGMRVLRLVARTGGVVDAGSVAGALEGPGRVPRVALAVLAEAAARVGGEATECLVAALDGPWRGDAAFLLSHVATEEALDALAPFVRSPGLAGLSAATALLAAEDDGIAYEALCERLCGASEAVATARALAGAAPGARWLREAEGLLGRWARRGAAAAEPGRRVAAAELTARGLAMDLGAARRATSSEDDELALVGARAAYALGDTEGARGTAMRLLRRGPGLAGEAFGVLVRWADAGDARALALVRHVVTARPVEIARGPFFEPLAGAHRAELTGVVLRALAGRDEATALEAARAVARLRDPPSVVPPVWT